MPILGDGDPPSPRLQTNRDASEKTQLPTHAALGTTNRWAICLSEVSGHQREAATEGPQSGRQRGPAVRAVSGVPGTTTFAGRLNNAIPPSGDSDHLLRPGPCPRQLKSLRRDNHDWPNRMGSRRHAQRGSARVVDQGGRARPGTPTYHRPARPHLHEQEAEVGREETRQMHHDALSVCALCGCGRDAGRRSAATSPLARCPSERDQRRLRRRLT